jgi:ferredoxin
MRIVLNPAECDGFGFCSEIVPDLITLDEWGFPVVVPGPFPAHLDRAARQAVRCCPRRALLLQVTDRKRRG